MRLRVLQVTTALDIGGAEMMILKLATHAPFDSGVLALLNWGAVGSMLRERDIPTAALRLTSPGGLLRAPLAARRVVAAFAPDIIQGWLYHGNLLAALLGRAAGVPAVWNIRQSLQTPASEKRHARMTLKMLTWLHRLPVRVIYNSTAARAQHEEIGFPAAKGIVIPNGFDTERFRPDRAARVAIRREFAIPAEAILVGQVGRAHSVKGHDVFLRAARLAGSARPDLHFMVVGRGVDRDPKLRVLAADPAVAARVHLIGERRDVERLNAALDIACNTSYFEAFPNAIGEAMACGIPAIVTDVGDARQIVGPGGDIIAPGRPDALAEAMLRLAGDDARRAALGAAARQRVLDLYAIDRVCDSYEALYRGILSA